MLAKSRAMRTLFEIFFLSFTNYCFRAMKKNLNYNSYISAGAFDDGDESFEPPNLGALQVGGPPPSRRASYGGNVSQNLATSLVRAASVTSFSSFKTAASPSPVVRRRAWNLAIPTPNRSTASSPMVRREASVPTTPKPTTPKPKKGGKKKSSAATSATSTPATEAPTPTLRRSPRKASKPLGWYNEEADFDDDY